MALLQIIACNCALTQSGHSQKCPHFLLCSKLILCTIHTSKQLVIICLSRSSSCCEFIIRLTSFLPHTSEPEEDMFLSMTVQTVVLTLGLLLPVINSAHVRSQYRSLIIKLQIIRDYVSGAHNETDFYNVLNNTN